MRMRIHEKDHLSVKLETDNGAYYSNRENTFITSCINELKRKKKTICFQQWHIEELKKTFPMLSYNYDDKDDCFYVKI